MQNFVVLDLETTGLDPRQDAIIEIALLKLDSEWKEIDRFSTLVNPGFVIPEEVTFLTGITNDDLVDAPFFDAVRSKVVHFLDEHPIVGHNVEFDISFLKAYGIPLDWRVSIDTFKIASFCSHELKSLNLSNIANDFWYVHEGAHRALSDTEATAFVFNQYRKRLSELKGMKKKIFSSILARTAYWTMFDILFSDSEKVHSESIVSDFLSSIAKSQTHERLIMPADSIPDFSQILSSQSGLEERPEQNKMLGLVTESFGKDGKVVIEAPTWVGKTIAYLLPSILHSVKTGEQVFVSTNTKTLQDQILQKDVPKLRSMLESYWLSQFSVQKLKWRKNYVSIARFSDLLSSEKFEFSEAIFVLKIAFWMLQTNTGELDELSFYGEDYGYVDEIVATDSSVFSLENPYKEQEYLFRAREWAKKANIVIVNHALLLSEFLEASSSGILPKMDRLVLDEVHNLESVWTDALRMTLSLEDLDSTLTEIERSTKRYNLKHPTDPFLFPEAKEQGEGIMLAASMIFEEFDLYFASKQSISSADGYGGWRATEMLLPEDFHVSEHAEHMKKLLGSLSDRLREFERILFLAPDALMRHFDRAIERFDTILEGLRIYADASKKDVIRILSKREGQPIRLVSVPLSIGPILAERLFKDRKSIVATSATLSVGGDFSYIQRILRLDGFAFEKLATDFDYGSQALLYVPSNLWDVRKEREKRAITDFLRDLIALFGGRTLMLFTSFSAIKETALALQWPLKSKWIRLLTQWMSGGKHKMLGEYLKHADTSVLFGTESFWEWVDIPGEDLELLIVHKFPFAVPTDPVFVARSKLYGNAFTEYALPNMVIKLKQGFGRLIRTKEDRGIMVLLDQRINAEWWNVIIDSLPKDLRIRSIPTGEFLDLLKRTPKFARNSHSW